MIVAGAIDPWTITWLISAIDEAFANDTSVRRHSLRNLANSVPLVCQLIGSNSIRSIVQDLLGLEAFAVRSIFFDKLPGANWKVPWHQDLSIAVKERREVPGFGPWSLKEGVPHVEPPAEVLEGMVTLRIHLDDCGEDNGPLRVIPGTHRLGRLGPEQIAAVSREGGVTCTARAGDVLAMRPLLVHASSPSRSPSHRRVIHVGFAASELPGGLEWHERIGAKRGYIDQ